MNEIRKMAPFFYMTTFFLPSNPPAALHCIRATPSSLLDQVQHSPWLAYLSGLLTTTFHTNTWGDIRVIWGLHRIDEQEEGIRVAIIADTMTNPIPRVVLWDAFSHKASSVAYTFSSLFILWQHAFQSHVTLCHGIVILQDRSYMTLCWMMTSPFPFSYEIQNSCTRCTFFFISQLTEPVDNKTVGVVGQLVG